MYLSDVVINVICNFCYYKCTSWELFKTLREYYWMFNLLLWLQKVVILLNVRVSISASEAGESFARLTIQISVWIFVSLTSVTSEQGWFLKWTGCQVLLLVFPLLCAHFIWIFIVTVNYKLSTNININAKLSINK